MALTIEIFPDGTAELGIDSPEMDAADRGELSSITAAFGHLLPVGEHTLSDWARHIEGAHPESVVASAYAGRLREIERQYTPPLPGLDWVIEHGPNTVGRDWVAGDIHGQYGKFMRALEAVGFDVERDRLFQVGDLIDRGRNSRQCLELAFEPWFYACLGNHERLALDALREGQDSGAWDLWFRNGGSWIYGEDIREVKTLLEAALPHLPLAREV
ncbi:MAG: hypothetical protein GX771_04490, partial [Halomonadaceae bacterium]|nr:hypothetical protein [Halomonadaceae bacterium]